MKNIILISILGLFGSCGSKSDKINSGWSNKNKTEIRSALTSLMASQDTDAFIIIEELKSGKFVQFSGNANEELYFSLPVQQLSDSEFTKAKSLLKRHNIAAENVQLFSDESASESGGSLNEFGKKINRDVEEGVMLVSGISTQVFGFDADVKLTITEN